MSLEEAVADLDAKLKQAMREVEEVASERLVDKVVEWDSWVLGRGRYGRVHVRKRGIIEKVYAWSGHIQVIVKEFRQDGKGFKSEAVHHPLKTYTLSSDVFFDDTELDA